MLWELGARPCSSTDLGHAPVSIPTALPQGFTHPQQPLTGHPAHPGPQPASKCKGACKPPSLHQQSADGEGREEEWEKEKLRGCRVGPEGAETQKKRARTGVNRQEEGG